MSTISIASSSACDSPNRHRRPTSRPINPANQSASKPRRIAGSVLRIQRNPVPPVISMNNLHRGLNRT